MNLWVGAVCDDWTQPLEGHRLRIIQNALLMFSVQLDNLQLIRGRLQKIFTVEMSQWRAGHQLNSTVDHETIRMQTYMI